MSCLSNSSDINQTFIIEPLAIDDIYTTGATLINSIIYFDRTDMLSAYTANLSSFVTTDTYVTGMTFSSNTITIARNDNVAISANINTLTGLTVTGSLSATTFYGDGSHLTGISTGETYTNTNLTTAALGGIPQNSTFNNRTMTQMWTDLLYPYQLPSFSSFTRTLITDYDLGQPVPNGFQTFTWGTLNSSNIALNSINIDQLYPSTVNVLSGSSNDFTQLINLTGATISAATQTLTLPIYRITGTNTISSAFTRTITANWKNRWYYGKNVNTSLTIPQITSLTTTGLITTVVNTPITFVAGTEFIYVVIPQSMAQPTDWRDSTTGCFGNNIPYSNISATTITNAYGISIPYNIYRSTNQITSAQNVWLCS